MVVCPQMRQQDNDVRPLVAWKTAWHSCQVMQYAPACLITSRNFKIQQLWNTCSVSTVECVFPMSGVLAGSSTADRAKI